MSIIITKYIQCETHQGQPMLIPLTQGETRIEDGKDERFTLNVCPNCSLCNSSEARS